MTHRILVILLALALGAGAAAIAVYARGLYRWVRFSAATLAAGFGLQVIAVEFAPQLSTPAAGLVALSLIAIVVPFPLDIQRRRERLAAEVERRGGPELDTSPLAAVRLLRVAGVTGALVVMGTVGAGTAQGSTAIVLGAIAVLALVIGGIKLLSLAIKDMFEVDPLDAQIAHWTETLQPAQALAWADAEHQITQQFRQFRPVDDFVGNRSGAEGGSPRGSAA